jgi:hypothetical protein
MLSTHHGTTDSTVTLDASGSITSTSTASQATSIGFRGTLPSFDRHASQWMSFLSAIQLAVAVYLLICGIFMLRQDSSLGRRMHWIYIVVKLPVAIAACGVAWWLWHGFLISQSVSNPSSGSAPEKALWFVLPAAIGMIYPVVLLMVLLMNSGARKA